MDLTQLSTPQSVEQDDPANWDIAAPLSAQVAALRWLALSPQRAEEVAAEVGHFAAAAAAVRFRLRFDSEPADWDSTVDRWQKEQR